MPINRLRAGGSDGAAVFGFHGAHIGTVRESCAVEVRWSVGLEVARKMQQAENRGGFA
jgi:hypothetical protein